MHHWQRSIVLTAAALLLPLAAAALCSRTINVPMAATGLSVVAERDAISGGVYPDILAGLQAKGQCSFAMSAMPRARLEMMFKSGGADLLIPATRAPQRDANGVFVPLIYNRATLISLRTARAPISSAQDLLDTRGLTLVLVRGFTYGDAYEKLAAQLGAQGRVKYESDPLAVARTLSTHRDWATIMAPSILVGAIKTDGRFAELLKDFRFEPLQELPWGDSGAYISNSSLSESDRNALKTLLEGAVQSGLVWKKFREYYGPEVQDLGIRPR